MRPIIAVDVYHDIDYMIEYGFFCHRHDSLIFYTAHKLPGVNSFTSLTLD